ncbi:sulfotransferase family 2 domain-containing protein [Roseovarius sp.]|uniref:sulfotransferase family 2 domain-containing protein n=1 Tax=Roseovarius sp. TaxID=1486281 RepID=UPI0035653D9A
MLIHDLQVIFVHVPKTAGQSIERAFLARLGESWETRQKYLLQPNDDPAVGPPRMAHLTAPEYRDLGHVTPEQFDAYFKFGFVRNPWTRLASEYRFRRSSIRVSFRSWLLEQFPEPGFDDLWRHVMPQSEYLYESDGHAAVDFVGRFETLEEDYRAVTERLGAGLPSLRRVNSTTNLGSLERLRHLGPFRGLRSVLAEALRKTFRPVPARWQDYYDADTRAFVARFYAEDIERFGYRFDR